MMRRDFVEKIYAGWLAKIIGIRMGAPVESWTFEQIENIYGELDGYPVDYREFAADDDSNGPIFLIRAIEDSGKGEKLEPQDVAEALLNYAPFEHGFFWWGGYGISTEHTAYLNLRNGIQAPESGSIRQNGSVIAEQIGGQIFIDTWGLVNPGNPDRAAAMAEKAASVTHGGNGIYGGIFIAVCISYAFVERDIFKIIEKGLSYLPENCEYVKVVRAVMAYHEEHPDSWRACRMYIEENFGYDRYPGVCHIIPNIAVMILALLYGKGGFSETLNLCNRCGWDTDCNVGNLATIMGVRGGLEAIDYEKWRRPVNDLVIGSGVMGAMNIMDVPSGALYLAEIAASLDGKVLPDPYLEAAEQGVDGCHFEFPGSTHAIRVKREHLDRKENYPKTEYRIWNTDESAASGERSLKVIVNRINPGENIYIYKKTYYQPEDFQDSRYDPAFSPTIYPGQKIHGSIFLPEYAEEISAGLYALDLRSGKVLRGGERKLKPGIWHSLEYRLPELSGALISEMGFCVRVRGMRDKTGKPVTALIDDLYADGTPSYSVEMERETEERWTPVHREISQFTRLKGLLYLENGFLNLSAADFGEAYTGRHDWEDYRAEFYITPVTGKVHRINVRVQGALRSYAAGLIGEGLAGIQKNENGYRTLTEVPFSWEYGKEYKITVQVKGNRITAELDGKEIGDFTDEERPYLKGAVGISARDGSHFRCRRICVRHLESSSCQ